MYAQALDGGDPEQEPSADGEWDALYTQDISLLLLGEGDDDTDTATMELQDPVKLLCGLEWRYDDIAVSESRIFALVDE
jgi:hypothetical protein